MNLRTIFFVLLPTAALADEAKDAKEPKEEEHAWEANIDMVYGTTLVETVGQEQTSIPNETRPVYDTSRVSVFSFLPSLEREIGKHFVVGARIPIIFGAPNTIQSRGDGNLPARNAGLIFGNLEIEGLYKHNLIDSAAVKMRFEGALELAFPTAPGTEPPRAGEATAPGTYPFDSYDRFAVAQAALLSRGVLDSALFEPGRFGLVPKLSLPMRFLQNKLLVHPVVKFEGLFDTTGKARDAAVGELVMGVGVSYLLVKWIEPAVHTWTSIVVSSSDEKDLSVAAIEPAIIGHVGPFSQYAGIIIPLAGRILHQDTLAFRIGVQAEF